MTAACAAASGAAAHGGAPVTPGALWTAWNPDPWVLVPLLALHMLYGRGMVRLRARRGRVPWGRIACFAGAEAALVAALVSPLEALSGMLVSAHMAQHLILIAVAPLLFVLARPEAELLHGVPPRLLRSAPWRSMGRLWSAVVPVLERPWVAALLHGAVMWLWHAPVAFRAAVDNDALHHLEHVSFFVTALLFWRGIMAARAHLPAAIGAALATTLHSGFLGALLTFADRPLYAENDLLAEVWGLTAQQDQQLAGLMMWVPGGAAYLTAAVLLTVRLLASSGRAATRGDAAARSVTATSGQRLSRSGRGRLSAAAHGSCRRRGR